MDIPVRHLVPEIVTKGVLASKQQPVKRCPSPHITDKWFVPDLIYLAKLRVAQFLEPLLIEIHQSSVKPQGCPTVLPVLVDLTPCPVAEKVVNPGLVWSAFPNA